MEYKTTVSAHVTILEQRTFYVNAENEEEAKEIADKSFNEELEMAYGWIDYDETNITVERN